MWIEKFTFMFGKLDKDTYGGNSVLSWNIIVRINLKWSLYILILRNGVCVEREKFLNCWTKLNPFVAYFLCFTFEICSCNTVACNMFYSSMNCVSSIKYHTSGTTKLRECYYSYEEWMSLVLSSITWSHAGGCGGKALHILNVGTGWRRMFSFMPQSISSWG